MHRRFPYTSRSPQPRTPKPRPDYALIALLSGASTTTFISICAVLASRA